MIEFTIKTLDSNDHQFCVDDETTVEQLKEQVLERMGVETHLQRFIFCGRVLQDNKKLADYGVHGKVIHMVQRAPPCLEEREFELQEDEAVSQNSFEASSNESGNFDPLHLNQISQQHIRRLMELAASAQGIEIEETPAHDLSPTASRLEFLRRLVIEIRTNLDDLSDNESDEPRNYPIEDPPEGDGNHALPNEVICPLHQRPLLYQIDRGFGTSREGRGRRIRAMRANYHSHPRDLGLLVEELHELHDEFAIFRELYITTLREASDSAVSISEETLQRRQRTADLCAELYHAFAHAYHIMSDVALMLSHDNSRLTSEALMRHPLPAHIHVMPPMPHPVVEVDPPSQPEPMEGEDPNLALAGTSNTPPTVNINIQPDPVTYQVQIETTVPLNVANVDNNRPFTGNAGQNSRSSQQPQNDAEPEREEPSDRRHLIEFENMFRGLGQGRLRDVEVVMSVEEITQPNSGTSTGSAPAADSQQSVPDAYITRTANMLHEIVMSVFRQGLIPEVDELFQVQPMEGPCPNSSLNSQTQGPSPPHTQTQPQSEFPTQPQEEPLNPAQTIANFLRQSLAQALSPETDTDHEQSQNSSSASQPPQNPRHPPLPRIRTQTVSIFDLVYDRFLACDSQHARRQLQLRRDESVQLGGPRLRDTVSSRIQTNVETLYERFNRFTLDDESLLIAGTLLLREATTYSSGRTLIPNELNPLRNRIQEYIRQLIQGEYVQGNQQQLADAILQQHSRFLGRVYLITPMRPNVDVIASVRAVLVRFLNEAMQILNISDVEVFFGRFRVIYPRIFFEICGVLSYCSLDGPAGLTMIYRSFITEQLQNIDEPVRDLLYSLSIENLNIALSRVSTNNMHYPQYIHRQNQPSCSYSSSGAVSSGCGSTSSRNESSGSSVSPMDVEVVKNDSGIESRVVDCDTNNTGNESRDADIESNDTDHEKHNAGKDGHNGGHERSNADNKKRNVGNEKHNAGNDNHDGIDDHCPPIEGIELDDLSAIEIPSTIDNTLVLTQVIILNDTLVTSEEPQIIDTDTSNPENRCRSPTAAWTSETTQNPANLGEETSSDKKDEQQTANNSSRFRMATVDDDMQSPEPMVTDSKCQDDTVIQVLDNFRKDFNCIQENVGNVRKFAPSATSSPIDTPVSSGHPTVTQDNGDELSEEASSDLNITENDSDCGNVLTLDVSKYFGRFRISVVDELARGYEPGSNRVDTDFDRGCLPSFNNLLKFRRELLRYPGSLEKARALLEGSRGSTPSPPLETVVVDNQSGRRNYVGGPIMLRRDMPHTVVSPEATEQAGVSGQTLRAIEAPTSPNDNDACASNTPNQSLCRSRRPRSQSPESPDSASFVPPARIAQYWGDQWVPTFTRDMQRQQSSDEPYSDAYLSGMPPKKRRCVRQARPPQQPNALVQESLQDISLRQGVPPIISSTFRDHLRRYLSAHSLASQNYDPRRYASAARFLTQTRNIKTSDETKQ